MPCHRHQRRCRRPVPAGGAGRVTPPGDQVIHRRYQWGQRVVLGTRWNHHIRRGRPDRPNGIRARTPVSYPFILDMIASGRPSRTGSRVAFPRLGRPLHWRHASLRIPVPHLHRHLRTVASDERIRRPRDVPFRAHRLRETVVDGRPRGRRRRGLRRPGGVRWRRLLRRRLLRLIHTQRTVFFRLSFLSVLPGALHVRVKARAIIVASARE